MNIVAPATAIFEFERRVRLNEDIIRYMTVKVENFKEGLASETAAFEEQEELN